MMVGEHETPNGVPPDPWQTWDEELAQLRLRHGSAGFRLESDVFAVDPFESQQLASGQPELLGAGPDVVVVHDGHTLLEFHGEAIDGDWRLSRVERYFGDPDALEVTPDEAQERAAFPSPEVELAALTDVDRPDPGVLFDSAAEVDRGEAIRVSKVGGFKVGSKGGVLAAGNPEDGWGSFSVLSRLVSGGEVTVEVSRTNVDGEPLVAALRLRLTEQPVAQWRGADGDAGDLVGLDSGALAIVDWELAAGLTQRDRVRLWRSFLERPPAPVAILTSGDRAFGVICGAGWGPGEYPLYWGLDDDGTPAQLVADFGILPGAPWADEADEDGEDGERNAEEVLLDEDTAARLAGDVDHGVDDLADLSELDRPDPGSLFGAGASVRHGELMLATEGHLCVGNPLGFVEELSPLRTLVPAGRHPVDLAVHDQRPAGLRVRFSTAEVAGWAKAERVEANTDLDCSEAIAVFDWGRTTRATHADRQQLRQLVREEGETIVMLGDEELSGVLIAPGPARPQFPVYWGIDSDGGVAQLIIDCGVAPGAPWREFYE